MDNDTTDLLNTLVGTGTLREEVRRMLQEEVQNALQAELTAFLGYEKNDSSGWGSGNSRNGEYGRKISTSFGDLELTVPRDRNGDFVQHAIPRYSRHAEDITEIIIELYTHGVTTRDTTDAIQKLYGGYYSPSTVSDIVKSLEKRAKLFHSRKFTEVYPFIFMNATYLNLRRDSVGKEALHVVMGITPDGHKEVLDFALFPTESATNYESLLMGLKERGGVLLGISDGLNGMEDMLRRIFPAAEHQSCWVHIQRNIIRLVRQKDREAISADLRLVYTTDSEGGAKKALKNFCEHYQRTYPKLTTFFSNKTNLFSFYHYPKSIRKTIYTTNLIESNNKSLKRKTKPKEQFPNEASLDRFVAIRYFEYNDKMSLTTHTGFKAAECELVEMVEFKYPEEVKMKN